MPFLLFSLSASFPEWLPAALCSCYPGSFARTRMLLVTLWALPCSTLGLAWLTLTCGLW